MSCSFSTQYHNLEKPREPVYKDWTIYFKCITTVMLRCTTTCNKKNYLQLGYHIYTLHISKFVQSDRELHPFDLDIVSVTWIMSQYQIWPTWQVFFFFYAYLPAHGINLDTVFNDRGTRNMGRTFKVGRKHHEGMLCVVILSVADRIHSRMDATQMLYWKGNTLKLHRSFLSFCSRDKCRMIRYCTFHTHKICVYI